MSTKLVINRIEYQDKQVLGEFKIIENGKVLFKGFTLELAWNENKSKISCIKKGVYKAEERETKNSKFKYRHFHIKDVESRKWILGHIGSIYKDIQGCILFGSGYKDINKDGYLDVINSKKTFTKMIELLPDEFEIIINGIW